MCKDFERTERFCPQCKEKNAYNTMIHHKNGTYECEHCGYKDYKGNKEILKLVKPLSVLNIEKIIKENENKGR